MHQDVINIMSATNNERLAGQVGWLDCFPKDFDSILDVGAGAGAHCAYFLKQGYTPVALDFQSDWFQLHNHVEFIHGDVMSLADDRQFDAVFCSHTLEHMPNPQLAIRQMRSLIKDDGYLFVALPVYDQTIANNHWNIGWNCSQLAMWLVACGFDCAHAVFMEINGNICGWGRKRAMLETNFYILPSLPYLPDALVKQLFFNSDGISHLPDAVTIAPDRFVPRPRAQHIQFDHAKHDPICLTFESDIWAERNLILSEPIDLSVAPLCVFLLSDVHAPICRVALSAKPNDFSQFAEIYLNANAGSSYEEFNADTCVRHGLADFSQIRHISVGGQGRGAHCQVWLSHNGQPIVFEPEVSADDDRIPRAEFDAELQRAATELAEQHDRAARAEDAAVLLRGQHDALEAAHAAVQARLQVASADLAAQRNRAVRAEAALARLGAQRDSLEITRVALQTRCEAAEIGMADQRVRADRAERFAEDWHRQLLAIRQSWSWRTTRPMRWLANRWR